MSLQVHVTATARMHATTTTRPGIPTCQAFPLVSGVQWQQHDESQQDYSSSMRRRKLASSAAAHHAQHAHSSTGFLTAHLDLVVPRVRIALLADISGNIPSHASEARNTRSRRSPNDMLLQSRNEASHESARQRSLCGCARPLRTDPCSHATRHRALHSLDACGV